MFALTFGVNSVCLLAKYLKNHLRNYDDIFRKYYLNSYVELNVFLSRWNLRWLWQLNELRKQKIAIILPILQIFTVAQIWGGTSWITSTKYNISSNRLRPAFKTLLLTISINAVCMLIKYLMNYLNLKEKFRNQSLNVKLQLFIFLESNQ